TEPDLQTGKTVAKVPNPGDKQFWELIDKVWERYGGLSAGQLSTLSHVSGGPWMAARNSGMTNLSQIEITKFYREKLGTKAMSDASPDQPHSC
ncbi:MAG: hypothetical protein QM586_07240, partial [Xenophilus sp.]